MPAADWPVELRGVTETVVTTRGPNNLWNVAALGVSAPETTDRDVATARTWGRTRTRRNFRREGGGYVQFTTDPVAFAEAALTVREEPSAVIDTALAWARVSASELDRGVEAGTEWVDWALEPVESEVVERTVPTTNRGYGAVVEATVAASRLDVEGYDPATLEDRLSYLEGVVERCGGERERRALDVVRQAADW